MIEIEHLREVLDGHRQVDEAAWVNLLRGAMRADPATIHALMDRAYVRGLEQAYAGEGDQSFAALANIGAIELDAIGEHQGAIARLDQAPTMVSGNSGLYSQILSYRSAYQALALDRAA